MQRLFLSSLFLLLAATPATARELCPERPGLGSPPCTIEPGRLNVEVGGLDVTHDATPDGVEDGLLMGDMLLRYGIADHAEIQLGWTAYGRVRSRDAVSGAIMRSSGTGDLALGLKRNFIDPEGQGFSIAATAMVSLPVGGAAIGAGDWGAAILFPMNVPVTDGLSFNLTAELDAAVDGDRSGRHLAYAMTGGLTVETADGFSLGFEAQALRDEDPDGYSTQLLAAVSAGLMIGEDMQVDVGGAFALNRQAPDTRLYFGVTRRF